MTKYSLNFISYSGDKFHIPKNQRENELAIYKNAVQRGDEKVMLLFEEGWTGWKYVGD